MTVGELRAMIANLEDDAVVLPDWAPGHSPHDDEPYVEILGLSVCDNPNSICGECYLSIEVGLFYLDDENEDE